MSGDDAEIHARLNGAIRACMYSYNHEEMTKEDIDEDMYLPEKVRSSEDIRIVATIMKRENISVPIKGYKIKNGQKVQTTYAYARANEEGDDIILETHNVKDAWSAFLDIFEQVVDHIRRIRRSA